MATYNINKIQLPNGDICNTSAEIIKLSNQENNSGISGPFPWNIPSGGSTGQVLKKKSDTNYDTEWGNATGGGTWGSITGQLANQVDLVVALIGKADASAVYTKTETDRLAAGYIPIMPNAGFHNGIYRGKYLGGSVTAEQYAAISAGTFEDLFIGDYWTINNINWRIASFDYWYGYGDTPCTTHHVAILPDTGLTNAKMNSTNVTTGAYAGSDFRTGSNGNTGMADALAIVNSAFGSGHVLQHRLLIRNTTSNGFETAGAAVDSKIEVMTETQVYGTIMFRNQKQGTNWASYQTLDDTQLPLFLLNRILKNIGVDYWLRDVGDTTGFCCVGALGQCSVSNASNSFAIRPIFGICA